MKEKKDMYSPTSWDVLLVATILVFAGALTFKSSIFDGRKPTEKPTASIYVDGVLVDRTDLETDREIGLLNGKMHVRVENEKIYVSRSRCLRKVCVNMGAIQHAGEAIVCAPFKVLIEIEAGAEPVVDAVVY